MPSSSALRVKSIDTRTHRECLAVEQLGRRCLPLYYTADELYVNARRNIWNILVLMTVTDAIVGYVVLGASGRSVVVMSIAVDVTHRRMGGCSALLRRAQACTTVLELHVKTDNTQAINCYTQNGFRCVGRVVGYYRSLSGTDAYLMRWTADTNDPS